MQQLFLDILKARGVKTEALEKAVESKNPQQLTLAWNMAYRTAGKEPVNPTEEEFAQFKKIDGEIDWSLWSKDELARALILVAGCESDDSFFFDIAAYFDLRETIAACRSLSLLNNSERLEQYATESCRTNSSQVFAAMAHGNPYPKRYFSDLSYDQMVLKAMFVGIALKPIVGLQERKTDETRRMSQDYCDELKAAGRSLPIEIELVLESQKEQEA